MNKKKLMKLATLILLLLIIVLIVIRFINLRDECRCPLHSKPPVCAQGEEPKIIGPSRFTWYCPACSGGVSCVLVEDLN